MADYPSLQFFSSIPVTQTGPVTKTGKRSEGVALTGTAIAWGRDEWKQERPFSEIEAISPQTLNTDSPGKASFEARFTFPGWRDADGVLSLRQAKNHVEGRGGLP
jgi:hypothetical protein